MLKRCSWCIPFLLLAAACGSDEVPAAPVGPSDFRPHPYDWPQWQGAQRTGISRETGLFKEWPRKGPPLSWKVQGLGGGYSTPAVAGGRVFGMSFRGDDEIVWALDEAGGKELWNTRIAKANRNVGYNEGPRSTPTVDGDLLYALGLGADLVCLESATGKERWHKNLQQDFGGHMMSGWGYSESPLVDGEKVIATPGGSQATLVALDKKTGRTIWKAQVPEGDGAGYASAIRADVNGHPQYVQFLGGGVVGVAADDGKFLWRYNRPANGTANCSTAIYSDQCVFAASGYGTGGGLVQIPSTNGEEPKQIYHTSHMKNQHGGMVLVDGHIYGSNEGLLACLDFKTGEVMWEECRPGKGSIACADGHLYYRNEQGPIVLVEANPKKYVERGRFDQPERSSSNSWSHPVIANGKLYVRDQDLLLCYDVKQH